MWSLNRSLFPTTTLHVTANHYCTLHCQASIDNYSNSPCKTIKCNNNICDSVIITALTDTKVTHAQHAIDQCHLPTLGCSHQSMR